MKRLTSRIWYQHEFGLDKRQARRRRRREARVLYPKAES